MTPEARRAAERSRDGQLGLFSDRSGRASEWTTAARGRPVVWSYGGGAQSAAIAVLVLRGELPRPERIVMADTSREASATWAYLDEVVQPALMAAGLRVEVAPHALATKGLYSTDGKPLMPVYTRGQGGGHRPRGAGDGVGQMRNFCSGEWKRDVVRRYVRRLGYGPAGRSERGPVANWLGISVDEIGRIGTDQREWIKARWPLVFDRPTTREECVALVREFGWSAPPKSSCWCCPYRTDPQWRALRDAWPEDFARAAALEGELRQRDGEVYLHRSGVPLAEAPLGGSADDGAGPCTSGQCWT